MQPRFGIRTKLLLSILAILLAALDWVDGDAGERPIVRQAHWFRAQHIGFVFQMFHLFPFLNVLDNVLVGMTHHAKTSLWQEFFEPMAIEREEKALKDKAMELLRLMNVHEVAGKRATSLPYGDQRRVESHG